MAFTRKLYGCETWSLTSREEHRLKVIENRVVWRLLGLNRDKIIFLIFSNFAI
jgi:hypothetical protein